MDSAPTKQGLAAAIQNVPDKNANTEKYMTTADLDKETVTIVKLVQGEVYAEEIKDLET